MFYLKQFMFCLVLLWLISPVAANDETKWRRGLVRVNTNVSAGLESFQEVAQQADNANLDFIIFSDQFLVIAEYGIPPFRNCLKISKTRPSIVDYGIEKYLAGIKEADAQFPHMVLIPGADIAPHYFWRGRPFSGDFSCGQFSEQLTVFGPSSVDFYKKLPVIHNENFNFSWMSIVKLLPLLMVIWGVLLFLFKGRGIDDNGYCDSLAISHTNKIKNIRILFSIFLIILGVIWTIHNRPFSTQLPFDQYADFDQLPYQHVIDYIRKNSESENCGVFWSAPEATMNDRIFGVKLFTQPYLEDILATKGHNGFAGIYGDTATAHKPGKAWDQLLIEYCQGKRNFKPVILGEIDYHGKGRKLDLIQTVVFADKLDSEHIIKAICNGNSYAYANTRENKILIQNISVNQNDTSASLGETLNLTGKSAPVLNIKGKIISMAKNKAKIDINVVSNGKSIYSKKFDASEFDLNIPIPELSDKPGDKSYIRLMLRTDNAGHLFTNPIFLKKEKSNSITQ